MQALRKPFTAVSYEGLQLGPYDLKTVLVIGQILGYGAAKYIGIKILSETRRERRFRTLIAIILWAEAMLLLFAVVPLPLKPVAILLNGLSLGMVWGVCILYVEGRRATELLLAGLGCSYILATGVVKDAGRLLMKTFGVGEFWMPAATGLAFLPVFVVAAWLLDQVPPPTAEDAATRTPREPMGKQERRAFLRHFRLGIAVQLAVYVAVTAFRDFRDAYGIEIWQGVGLAEAPAIFTRSEAWVGLAAFSVLVALRLFDSRRWGVVPNIIFMILGLAAIGGSTLLHDAGLVDGFGWMVLAGAGALVAYVSCDTVFYERVIASTGWTGTAVFMACVMDAGGYSGSVALQLWKAHSSADLSYFAFFKGACYVLSVAGIPLLLWNLLYFASRSRRPAPPSSQRS